MKLEILHPTVIKLKPIDSNLLPDNEKANAIVGDIHQVEDLTEERGHFKFKLAAPLIGEHIYYYLFKVHCRALGASDRLPDEVKLEVEYKSQLDNFYNPTGSCNVTSIATVLAYLGAAPTKNLQLEDELYQQCIDFGWSRHSPGDLAKLVERRGYSDDFRVDASIDTVRNWLAERRIPVVTHGYFTSFGHIIVLVGYNSSGFWVHDPYGEWFSGGYRTDLSGAYCFYSYRLIRRLCMPDGNFWVHFIS